MKCSNLFLMLFFLAVSDACFGQKQLDEFIASLHNKDVRYEVVTTRPVYKNDSTLSASGYFVQIRSLNTKTLFQNFDKKKLIQALTQCLSDEERDWYANLLLYELTQKHAMIFMAIENRREWVNCCSSGDLKSWKELLRNEQNPQKD